MTPIIPTHTFNYAGCAHNVYHAQAGEGLPKHDHVYSHGTICHAGKCVVRKEKGERVITPADGCFNLVAGEWHEIEALEDGTVFENIFAEQIE